MRYCLRCEAPFESADGACPGCSVGPVCRDGIEHHAPDIAISGTGFRPEYFDALAGLEAANFWFRARNELIVDVIGKHCRQARTFLEIGCGTGFVLSGVGNAFPHMALSGSELFAEGLVHAARRIPQARVMQMDARRIPFSAEFDIIGAFDVIEHIEEDEAVLASIHRALNPGGCAIFTVPQHPWLWSGVDEYACHVRRYRRGELERKLADAGLAVVFTTSFVTLLLPLLVASRLPLRKAAARDTSSQLRLPWAINTTLRGIMQLERQLIRAGIRFPLGGTRLVCATKPT